MRMDNWSIGRRLAVGFGAILALLLVLAGVYLYGVWRQAEATSRLTLQVMPRADAANDVAKAYLRQSAATRSYVYTGDPKYVTAYWDSVQQADAAVNRLASLPKTDRGQELFGEIQSLAGRYQRATERAVGLRQQGDMEGAADIVNTEMLPVRDTLMEKTEEFVLWQFLQRGLAVDAIESIQTETSAYSSGLLLLVLLISVTVAVHTARAVQGPAARLAEASRALMAGNFESGAQSAAGVAGPGGKPSRNEIRELAGAFRSMAESLQRREKRLLAQAKLSSALASSVSPEEVGTEALREMAAYAGLELGAVYAFDGEANLLRRVAGYSLDGAPETLRPDEGIPGEAATSRRPIVVRDIPADAPFRIRFGFDELPPRVIVAAPLVVQDTLAGVLVGGSVREMSDDVLDFVRASSQQLAVSLQNAVAHREVERLAGELQDRNERLQAQNEEIQAQSEELQAQNEELQAQNEELQAQSEELQTQSEELQAQNQEIQTYTDELAATNLRLEQQRALLRTILARIPEAVQVTDETGKVILSNPAAKKLFGEQAVRREEDAAEIGTGELAASDAPEIWPATLRALQGEVVLSEEMAVRNAETGEEAWMLVSAVPLLEGSRVTNVVAVAADIGQLKEVDRLKDEFLSIAAHELRSPLTSLKGFAQLLERRLGASQDDPSIKRSLQTISGQADKIVRLVDRLLGVSRAQMGRLEMNPEEVDVGDLVRRVVAQAQIKSERHVLVADVAGDSIIGYWDRGYLEQALDNLLDNAIRYSPKGGDVTVSVATEDGLVRVTVADQGIGMPPETIANLYKRYYRSQEAKAADASGMGIGLYVTHEIVTQHGGRIFVESERGRGSKFTVELPAAQSVGLPAAMPEAAAG
jgi:two-component system, OmpR family, phosphate regulon sensor histidine kinase PhoR